MKFLLAFVFVIPLFLSCSDESQQTNLQDSPTLIPDTFKEADFTKVFIHNNAGQLSEIKMISRYPNGNTMESVQLFSYDTSGQLTESTTDTGWRFVYFLSDNKITRTDEYVNGTRSQYHTFAYDNKNRMVESITWQNIPQEGGEIPVSKDTYEFDLNDNLVLHQLYYYTSFGAEAKLLTSMAFSDYDNHINSEDHFDINPFNPLPMFSKNNPGKLIIKNGMGVIASTETYSYDYHAKGYALKKTVHFSAPDNQSGIYEATYSFKD